MTGVNTSSPTSIPELFGALMTPDLMTAEVGPI